MNTIYKIYERDRDGNHIHLDFLSSYAAAKSLANKKALENKNPDIDAYVITEVTEKDMAVFKINKPKLWELSRRRGNEIELKVGNSYYNNTTKETSVIAEIDQAKQEVTSYTNDGTKIINSAPYIHAHTDLIWK